MKELVYHKFWTYRSADGVLVMLATMPASSNTKIQQGPSSELDRLSSYLLQRWQWRDGSSFAWWGGGQGGGCLGGWQ